MSSETLPPPTFIQIPPSTGGGGGTSSISYASANFYRIANNSNIVITVPIGTDPLSEGKYLSPNVFLPISLYNEKKENTIITFPNNRDANVLTSSTCLHDILIQYKMTKSDGTNYANSRDIRTTLVHNDGVTEYDSAIFSNQQPDTGQHDFILVKGSIDHNINDVIKIKFNIGQNNMFTDQTDTKLTIFRVTWTVTCNITAI